MLHIESALHFNLYCHMYLSNVFLPLIVEIHRIYLRFINFLNRFTLDRVQIHLTGFFFLKRSV